MSRNRSRPTPLVVRRQRRQTLATAIDLAMVGSLSSVILVVGGRIVRGSVPLNTQLFFAFVAALYFAHSTPYSDGGCAAPNVT